MATLHHFFDDIALCKELQNHIKAASKTFILTDSNVAEAILPRILANIPSADLIEIIEVEPNEESKSIEVATQIWGRLLECNADRKTLLINVGGGVITDLGGFIGSTYKRGIPFIHIPTSLMAMTDAAIGGKTGIDFDQFKNVIGTFAPPNAILIQPDFINSLPQTEILSGFAEMIKHGIIADQILFEALENIDDANPDHIALFIERSTNVKVNIVNQDFKETGLRKTLNFGHTIGHAIESVCLNTSPISHGNAVGIGMNVEAKLAYSKGLLDETSFLRILKMLNRHYPSPQQFNWTELLPFLKNDKKNQNGEIHFALPTSIGTAKWDIAINESEIKQAMTGLLIE